MRETDGPPLSTTHTASNPTAIPVGFSPTWMESRISCSLGSIRVTVPTSGLVTHTASADAATDPGRSSSPTVAVTSPDSGSRTPIEFGSISESPPGSRAHHRDGDQCRDHGERDHRRDRLPPSARWRRGRPDERGDRLGVVPVLRTHRDHVDRLVEPLQLRLATLGEPDAVDPTGEVDDLPAREHLAGAGERAEPRGDVQRAAPVAALDGYGLAGVESDPDREREGWIGDRLLDEPLLQGHGAADRRARRTEDDQGLVTAELEHVTAVSLDHASGSPRRSAPPGVRPPRPPFLRERRPAADVGDQERVDVSVAGGVRQELRSTARLTHRRRPAIRWNTHRPSMDPPRGRRHSS